MAGERLAELFVEISTRGKIDEEIARTRGNLTRLDDAFKGSTEVWSAKFRDFAAANMELASKQEKFRKTLAWEELVMKQGMVGASLTTLSKKLDEFQRAMPMTFQQATSSLLGFVAAASPETFGTFTGSIQLVAAAVGEMFVPAVIEASRWIQEVYHWIQELSPEQKEQIVKWTLIGVSALGAVFALSKVVGVAKELWTVLQFGGTVLKFLGAQLYTFVFAHPYIAGILAIAAAVGVLTGAFGLLGNALDDALSRSERMTQLGERLADGAQITRREYEDLFTVEQRQRLQNAPNDAARRQILGEFRGNAQATVTANQAAAGRTLAIEGALSPHAARPWYMSPGNARLDALRAAGVSNEDMIRGGVATRGAAGQVLPSSAMHNEALTPDRIRQIARQLSGESAGTTAGAMVSAINNMLTNGLPTFMGGAGASRQMMMSSPFSASFRGLEQQWTAIQQRAASGGSLEAERERIRMRSLNAAEQTARNTAILAGEPPPPPPIQGP